MFLPLPCTCSRWQYCYVLLILTVETLQDLGWQKLRTHQSIMTEEGFKTMLLVRVLRLRSEPRALSPH